MLQLWSLVVLQTVKGAKVPNGVEESPLCIPLSTLKEAAFEYSQVDGNSSFWWKLDSHFALLFGGSILNKEIPCAFSWEAESDIPQEIMQQFIGQQAQAGITIVYRERRYIAALICFTEYPKVGSTFEFPPQLEGLILVDADFIALDC